ncbi:MAG: hypothetical protein WCJ39_09695 [bacterium]
MREKNKKIKISIYVEIFIQKSRKKRGEIMIKYILENKSTKNDRFFPLF